MSTYRGPRLRLMRRLGMQLPGLSRKTIERRPYPPGQHGPNKQKSKLSTYGEQLREKQILRFNYGITERQLKIYAELAFKGRGHPGQKLLELLERRLDSVVFRAGLAPTIPSARQLVSHNHVLVNNKRVNIASYLVKVGETITLTDKGKKLPVVEGCKEQPTLIRPAWLDFDNTASLAKMMRLPDRDSFPIQIRENLVVEYYTQRT